MRPSLRPACCGVALHAAGSDKQRWGRLMKMQGDICLMAGSPADAAEHYRSACDIAKAVSDWVW